MANGDDDADDVDVAGAGGGATDAVVVVSSVVGLLWLLSMRLFSSRMQVDVCGAVQQRCGGSSLADGCDVVSIMVFFLSR